ncbi:hypothetical protein AHiyo8_38310 [Arthrobacter sp. Hiyo8]|nr:hypothetical protein AHiyo8_38310 [Arthrobacter sp. Hiyo8]
MSEPSVPGVRGAIFGDTRDITPFRNGHVRTSVGGLAEGLGGAIWGVLRGKAAGRIDVAGDVPRLKRLAGKTAKSVYDAVFTSTEPDRLITLARTYPGWAGLCYVIAGLLVYKHGGYLRASELLQRGLSIRIDDAASQFSSSYLRRVVTRIEVAERIDVSVLFSEESVFLALSHCFRETGQTAEALDSLASLPPSLPSALARCTAAAALERHADVVAWTEGLRNTDDLSAALLLIRAQSLRMLGSGRRRRPRLRRYSAGRRPASPCGTTPSRTGPSRSLRSGGGRPSRGPLSLSGSGAARRRTLSWMRSMGFARTSRYAECGTRTSASRATKAGANAGRLRPTRANDSPNGDPHGADKWEQHGQDNYGVRLERHASACVAAIDPDGEHKPAPAAAGSIAPIAASAESKGHQRYRNQFFSGDLQGRAVRPRYADLLEGLHES